MVVPSHFDLAAELAREQDAGRIHDPAVPSLLRVWSDGGWTGRQVAKVRAILDHADPIPGETRAVPPTPYDDGSPWWHDLRPERQALRGRKSGIVRRWRQRNRDELIHRWYDRGKRTVAEMAAHFGMSRQGVYYVLNRVVSAALPRLAGLVKRTIQKRRTAVKGECLERRDADLHRPLSGVPAHRRLRGCPG